MTELPAIELEAPEPGDRIWMARALEQARLAELRGEVPVGAVVVREGSLLAEAHNRTVLESDPTGHAERVALARAGRKHGDWRLEGATLYATLEPCAMCAGAIVLSRVDRVVFGARDPKAGMVVSLGSLVSDPRLNHRARISEGVCAEAASHLLKTFFRARRGHDD